MKRLVEVALGDTTRVIGIAKGKPASGAATDPGERFLLELDGQTHTVDVQRSGTEVRLAVDRQIHRITVASTPSGFLLDDGIRSLEARTRRVTAASSRVSSADTGVVRAPMPGRVVRVLVQEGTEVSAKQPLVVMEAMKMQNEVRARAAGVVKEVHVREGDNVERNATLIVM